MRWKLGFLFIVIIISILVISLCSESKIIFSNDSSFTSGSGFSDSEQDAKEKEETINCNTVLGGNVGIGIADPKAKLHIGGSIGIDGIMFPDGTLQTTAVNDAAGDGGVGGNWTSINNDIYNTNSGNIGIGTNSPVCKLEVIGNIQATSINGNDVIQTQSFQVFPVPGMNSPFYTTSTNYATISHTINGGLTTQFLSPLNGTTRYYRLKVTYTDNIMDSDEVYGSNLRYFKDGSNTEIFNLALRHSSASTDWIKQKISHRFRYVGNENSKLETRSGVDGKYLQIYGIWIIAEDVVN
ncbi:MAG: hypothetical protein GY777_27415 [Candidatus Brocadiaceae bacterium]|nr:hypothetical protein [Candidatus Brocadiaceae bacterium]